MCACVSAGIPRIEHLWGFPSLVRLDLNNNLIEKMEGLTCLSNLISLSKDDFRLDFGGCRQNPNLNTH